MRKLAILGSTGSIGTQALDVAARHSDRFAVTALVAHSSSEKLFEQVRQFHPQIAALSVEPKEIPADIRESCQWMFGENVLLDVVRACDADDVLVSVVGVVGLAAVMEALACGKRVLLANKEPLVAGGELVTEAAKKAGHPLLPVDSEHSAIFQCLQDQHSAKTLEKILLTASGGPFFGMKTEELRGKTKADALKHPNWNMGAKITIDSATLMNKGLELIEAVWLFGLPPEKIQIVVQRQSIVHSAVQYSDNSIIAQLGVPDMRIPIQYALTYPARVPGVVPELDFTTLKLLTFDVADEETFRCLAACKKAIKKGGLGPCAANGANEEAVKLFLEDKIGFLDIGRLVEAVVDSDSFGGDYSLADVYECDRMARAFVRAHL